MSKLKVGDEIKTRGLKTAKVIKELGRGGQGIVYEVDYSGEKKALKWYYYDKLRKPEVFYDNLQNNIKNGQPHENFVWMEDISEKSHGSFGYIMPLWSPDYDSLAKFLLRKINFYNKLGSESNSYKLMTTAALNIISAFEELHLRGYSYQDLNEGGLAINYKNGSVLICDCDNVSKHGSNTGIIGIVKFMAPEVVLGIKMPDVQTDRHSLAVVLFMLFFLSHPLEGKGYLKYACAHEKVEEKIYGKNPIFVYDVSNTSNRPDPVEHKNLLNLWPVYPQYIRDIFISTFSNEQLHQKTPRTLDSAFLKAMMRFRNDIITCQCGNEEFLTKNQKELVCSNCGNNLYSPFLLKFSKSEVPVFSGAELYPFHTEKNEDYSHPAALIVSSAKDPTKFGIKNLSKDTWYIQKDGKTKELQVGETHKLSPGLTINFGKEKAEIIEK